MFSLRKITHKIFSLFSEKNVKLVSKHLHKNTLKWPRPCRKTVLGQKTVHSRYLATLPELERVHFYVRLSVLSSSFGSSSIVEIKIFMNIILDVKSTNCSRLLQQPFNVYFNFTCVFDLFFSSLIDLIQNSE